MKLTEISKMNENRIITKDETITLYHGSKSGIYGEIAAKSRVHCDFGKGFYMGTEPGQPLTLICNYPEARLYTMEADLSGLKILDVEVGLDWALLIAYSRGKMETVKDTAIYKTYSELVDQCDMMVGYIANDRMFVVLDRFFNGEITDAALINSLSALKLGKQYVALTPKACSQIKIIKETHILESDRRILKYESGLNRLKGVALAEEICRKYRREGRFFDEILEEME